jgi:uncharacterized protein YdbL (DUF1318 family)
MAAAVFAVGLWAAPAAAQSLDELRASGAIGERFDGLVEARDAGAAAAVKDINAKRQEIYAQRAAAQGVPADQVGRVYAQEIMQKAPGGTWFLSPDNTWTQK